MIQRLFRTSLILKSFGWWLLFVGGSVFIGTIAFRVANMVV